MQASEKDEEADEAQPVDFRFGFTAATHIPKDRKIRVDCPAVVDVKRVVARANYFFGLLILCILITLFTFHQ